MKMLTDDELHIVSTSHCLFVRCCVYFCGMILLILYLLFY